MKDSALIAAALCLFAIPAFAGLILTPSPVVSAGSTATVEVYLTGAPAADFLLGYGFNVTVNNTAVATFAGFTPAAAFMPGGALPPGTNVLASSFIDTSDPTQYTEPFLLATLSFDRVGWGTTTFSLVGDPSDPNQGIVYLTAGTEVVRETGTINFVPEPMAALELGVAALAALVAFGKRRA
jgi:hypothetical protein